ncbi:MAG: biopolymer transporter ExbD [Pseudomonadota bacterium]
MRGRRTREVEEAKVDLTPMLDVVFILLIFFIVTAVFLTEEAIPIEPPPPSNDNPPDEPVPTILIRVDADNLIYVNNRIADVSAVRANIERLRAETPNSAVIIQAHPEAKNGLIVRIRDQAASANIEKVNLLLSDV